MAEPMDSAARSIGQSGIDPKAKALPLLRLDEVGGRIGAWCLEHQRLVIAAAIMAGLVCRLGQYLWQISFWHDEAFLVLNVFGRSGWGLVGPLDVAKGAPQQCAAGVYAADQGADAVVGKQRVCVSRDPDGVLDRGDGALCVAGAEAIDARGGHAGGVDDQPELDDA